MEFGHAEFIREYPSLGSSKNWHAVIHGKMSVVKVHRQFVERVASILGHFDHVAESLLHLCCQTFREEGTMFDEDVLVEIILNLFRTYCNRDDVGGSEAK